MVFTLLLEFALDPVRFSFSQEVGKLVEGVIVGSKLINIARDSDDPAMACGQFVSDMTAALKHNS